MTLWSARPARLVGCVGILALLQVAQPACSSPPPIDDDALEDELSNASPPTEAELSAVVTIFYSSGFRGCTATRVGPRHFLTAAHCVTTFANVAQLSPAFVPSGTFYVANGNPVIVSPVGPGTERVRLVEVERTHVAWKRWEELVRQGVPHDGPGHHGAPDVALVVLTPQSAARLEGVAEAVVNLRAAPATGPAFLVGYGCDSDVISAPRGVHPHSIERPASLVAADRISDTEAQTLSQSYLFTFGRSCPGNSGGPTFRRTKAGLSLVGVHSGSRDRTTDQAITYESRVDASSRDDIGSWLASLGARTTGAAHARRFANCRAFEGIAETTKTVCGDLLAKFDESGGEAVLGLPIAEARLEMVDAKPAWSQRFERARLWAESATGAVAVEMTADPCEGAGDGEVCAGDRSEDERDLRKVLRCSGGKTAARRFCGTSCDPTATSGLVSCR